MVRYLQDNGTMVQEGEAYVELEAMKMIMPIKATGTGKVSHLRGAGSIVSAGELLGTLELKDPSKVKKIVPFEGSFEISTASAEKVGKRALDLGFRWISMDFMGNRGALRRFEAPRRWRGAF